MHTTKAEVFIVDEDWLTTQEFQIDYTRFDIKTANKIKALCEVTKKN
jgi:hypothetical protein